MSNFKMILNQKLDLQMASLRSDDVQVPPTDIPVWTTSDDTVVTINNVGVRGTTATAIAVGVGTATITVSSQSLTATFVIDVAAKPTTPTVASLLIKPGLPTAQKPPFSGYPV